MKLSHAVKPLSYFKTHASDVVRDIADKRTTCVITLHGEAKAIVQDVASYEETQESLALLKILAQSSRSVRAGRVKPLAQSFATLTARLDAWQKEDVG